MTNGCFTVFVSMLVIFEVIVDAASVDVAAGDFLVLAVIVIYIVLVDATGLGSRPGSKMIVSASALWLPCDDGVAAEGAGVNIVDGATLERLVDD